MGISTLLKEKGITIVLFYSVLFIVLGYFAFTTLNSAVQVSMPEENDECMACHDDKVLYKTRRSKRVSMYVNANHLLGSVHAGVKCIDCHTDLAGADLPHEGNLKPATYGKCHKKEQADFDISSMVQLSAEVTPLLQIVSFAMVAIKSLTHNTKNLPFNR